MFRLANPLRNPSAASILRSYASTPKATLLPPSASVRSLPVLISTSLDPSPDSLTPSVPSGQTGLLPSLSHLKLLLPLPTKGSLVFHINPKDTVEEFLYDLKAEDRSLKNAQILRGAEEEGSVPIASKESFSQLLADMKPDESLFLSMDQKVVAIDVTEIQGRKKSTDLKLKELEPLLALLTEKKELLDRTFGRRHLAYRLGFAGFLTTELAIIIHLTYDLGWDLMEPVTYLLGLGTGTLAYAFYGVVRAEFAFENHMNAFLERRRLNLYRKNGFDIDQYQHVDEVVKKLRSENGHLLKLD